MRSTGEVECVSPQGRWDAEISAEFHATDGVVVERAGQARECDFDAEARRRGDKRREAAQSKKGRARRQRRMVAFGAERTGFRRERILEMKGTVSPGVGAGRVYASKQV